MELWFGLKWTQLKFLWVEWNFLDNMSTEGYLLLNIFSSFFSFLLIETQSSFFSWLFIPSKVSSITTGISAFLEQTLFEPIELRIFQDFWCFLSSLCLFRLNLEGSEKKELGERRLDCNLIDWNRLSGTHKAIPDSDDVSGRIRSVCLKKVAGCSVVEWLLPAKAE